MHHIPAALGPSMRRYKQDRVSRRRGRSRYPSVILPILNDVVLLSAAGELQAQGEGPER